MDGPTIVTMENLERALDYVQTYKARYRVASGTFYGFLAGGFIGWIETSVGLSPTGTLGVGAMLAGYMLITLRYWRRCTRNVQRAIERMKPVKQEANHG